MRLVAAGIVLMLAGLAALFLMVVDRSAPPLLLALAAFGASLAGLVLALIGLGRRLPPG